MSKWQRGAEKLRQSMDAAGVVLTDEQAAQVPAIFMPWNANATYETGIRVRYEDYLYRCLTAHTAQESWKPNAAPSLWVCVDNPADEWPEWKQPGAANPGGGVYPAYDTGAKVSYKGKRYISKINANTWSPEAYPAGWEEQL